MRVPHETKVLFRGRNIAPWIDGNNSSFTLNHGDEPSPPWACPQSFTDEQVVRIILAEHVPLRVVTSKDTTLIASLVRLSLSEFSVTLSVVEGKILDLKVDRERGMGDMQFESIHFEEAPAHPACQCQKVRFSAGNGHYQIQILR